MPETQETTTQTETSGTSPWGAQTATADPGVAEERPELVVGAALLGGFVLAQILKRLGGSD